MAMSDMAMSDLPRLPSKEMIAFASDALDYVWQHYSLNYPNLDRAFTEKLKIDKKFEEEDRATRHFNEDIGNAVLCTQCLMREFCHFYFTCHADNMAQSSFYSCTYMVLNDWIEVRTNVFHKVLDSIAIIAEAFMFNVAELNIEVNLKIAHHMLAYYLNKKKFRSQFFAEGGWKQLKEIAYNDFVYLHICLEPFMCRVRHKYERLNYDCKLIRILRDSPIFFPVENSKFCPECEEFSNTSIFEFRTKLVTIYSVESFEEECMKEEQEQPLDLSAKAETLKFSQDTVREVEYRGSFICRFLGIVEMADGSQRNMEIFKDYTDCLSCAASTNNNEKPSSKKKKKKKRKRKSKSKAESDTAQQEAASSLTSGLEAVGLQDSEESCEE